MNRNLAYFGVSLAIQINMRARFNVSVFMVLIVSFFMTVVFPNLSFAGLLDPEEFEGAKQSSLEIVQKASPDEFVYVGIGRSPTPIITLLSILYPGSTVGLPFTGASQIEKTIQISQQYNNNKTAELDRHFQEILGPVIKNLNGRKLLFMDYVVNGSFFSALRLLNDFLKRKYPHVQSDYIVLANSVWPLSEIPKEKLISVNNNHWEFERRLKVSYYHEVSPFGAWHLTGNTEDGAYEPAKPQHYHAVYAQEMRVETMAEVGFLGLSKSYGTSEALNLKNLVLISKTYADFPGCVGEACPPPEKFSDG